MLEHYFESTTRIRQMRSGLLKDHIDDFAAYLSQRGYAPNTARHILSLASSFNRFAAVAEVKTISGMNEKLLRRFISEELSQQGKFKNAEGSLQHVVDQAYGALIPQGERT